MDIRVFENANGGYCYTFTARGVNIVGQHVYETYDAAFVAGLNHYFGCISDSYEEGE